MPRFSTMGFAPDATAEKPSDTMDCASIVAVVVPSPAMSFVFEATSLTSSAPTFSNLSSRSMSLATVTPSFVITGEPNPRSNTTFLPRGPSVTFTAFASLSTPRLRDSLASSLYKISFDMFV